MCEGSAHRPHPRRVIVAVGGLPGIWVTSVYPCTEVVWWRKETGVATDKQWEHRSGRVDVDSLVAAHAQYSTAAGLHYDEVLAEVQERAWRSGSLGKVDIGALMLWKRLNLSTRWAGRLNEWADIEVCGVTGRALEAARDTSRPVPEAARQARIALLSLPGCQRGAAVASTLLTAGAPERMAIYDSRAVAALVRLGYDDPRGRYSRYMMAVCDVQDRVNAARSVGWLPRDVDKALFMST